MPAFLRWTRTAWVEYTELRSYRVYVTDALRLVAENAAKIGGGSVIRKRWVDIIQQPVNTDNRTADQIIADIVEKAGIVLV